MSTACPAAALVSTTTRPAAAIMTTTTRPAAAIVTITTRPAAAIVTTTACPAMTASLLRVPAKRPHTKNAKVVGSSKQQREDFVLDEFSMLTDDHVWAALQLLKKQFPGMAGLQNPVIGAVLQFAVTSGPFVQVLHDGELHWVTVITPPPHVDADVIVYDSLNRSVNMHCKMQIASLLSTTHSTIGCVVDTSQRQSGVIDCGLNAFAAATSDLCVMRNSRLADQAAMRGHLRTCIERGVMTHFPSSMRLGLMCNLIIIAIAMILKSTSVSSHQDALI